MKNNKLYIFLLTIFLVSSCNSWLDVQPRTESTREDLFTSEKSYMDAVTGVYIQLMNNDAYGSSLTFNTIEYMASLYQVTNNSFEDYLAEHNWGDSDVESKMNSIFTKLYKVISNSNSILDMLDTKPAYIPEKSLSIMKGELLAVRAMCHLDILRLFGPVPSTADGSRILPYVTEFGRELTEHSTFDEYTTQLLKDIKEAEELLKNNDPILEFTQYDLSRPTYGAFEDSGISEFYSFRHLRLNYYAVKALEARTNNYIGNKDAAYAAAKTLIEAVGVDGELMFTLGDMSAMTSGDYLFSTEHILAFSDHEKEDKYDTNFASGNLYKGSGSYWITRYLKTNLYEGSGVDIREPEVGQWWGTVVVGNGSTYGICNKYSVESNLSSSSTTGDADRMPIFRLAEMYLIAAETAPLAEAQILYDNFRKARNLQPITLTEDGRAKTILVEIRKEFYAEGHLFYAYKRNNSPKSDILWATVEPSYVIPKPLGELSYNEE